MQPAGYIQLELTSRCNLACAACPRGAGGLQLRERDMPRDIFERAVDETMHPGRHYHLQGWGEPLLREDLPELARSIRERGGLPSITTNGTLVTEELAGRLVEAGLEFITISFGDGRSGVTAEDVAGALRLLKSEKRKRGATRPLLCASFELTRSGVGGLKGAVVTLKRAGAERLIAINPIMVLTAEQERNLLSGIPDRGEKKSALWAVRRAALAAMWRSIPFHIEPIEPRMPAVCREDPLGSLFIGPSGDVSPCVFLGVPCDGEYAARFLGRDVRRRRVAMGNLQESSLAQIWDSDNYREFRNAFEARRGAGSKDEESRPPLPGPCRVCLRSLGY
jgi:MoaA/NifB/PqqE/SkfB family radical SAM enzyme